MRSFVIAVGLMVVSLLAACGGSSPAVRCYEDSTEFIANVDDLKRRWDDALEVAQTMPRMTLAGYVPDLQTLRREAEDLTVPECENAQAVGDALPAMMQAWIDTLLLFAGGEEGEVLLEPRMTVAKSDYEVAYNELTRPGQELEESDLSCEERTAVFLEEADRIRTEFDGWAEEVEDADDRDLAMVFIFMSGERENVTVMPRLDGCPTAKDAEILRLALLDYTTTAVQNGIGEDVQPVDEKRSALDAAHAALAPTE